MATAAASVSLGLSGCQAVSATTNTDLSAQFTVTSPAFAGNHPIPPLFTCAKWGGQGKTPPLRWSEPNAGAFAIVVDDPDAPGGDYIHWVIANIDGHTTELLEGVLPAGAVQGLNGAGTVGYTPPCPPKGEKAHRYRFTVYALKKRVDMKQGASLKESLPKIAALAIGMGRISGNFGGQ
jgi:Raf kinase inhibitor-like YbhB/YbcL family protein